MIVGLFTAIQEVGGIERIARHTAAALAEIAGECGERCEILGLNDAPGTHTVVVGGITFSFIGYGGRKGRFVRRALSLGSRAGVLYIGHPHMGQLGWVIRRVIPWKRYWIATYGVEVWEPLPLFLRHALRASHGITTLSKYTADMMVVRQGVASHKIALLPPALDPEFLAHVGGNSAAPSLSGKRVLLTVARLLAKESGKGVDLVLQALPAVLRACPDTHYVIVGDGDQRDSLQRMALDLGISGQVTFVGSKVGKDLTSYFQRADLFVMPSRQEGFGIVYLEAMAFGKPVIAAKSGGASEVVLDGETGYVVAYGDIAALAERITRVLCNDVLARDMGEAGRQRVQQHYTFEHFRHNLRKVLLVR